MLKRRLYWTSFHLRLWAALCKCLFLVHRATQGPSVSLLMSFQRLHFMSRPWCYVQQISNIKRTFTPRDDHHIFTVFFSILEPKKNSKEIHWFLSPVLKLVDILSNTAACFVTCFGSDAKCCMCSLWYKPPHAERALLWLVEEQERHLLAHLCSASCAVAPKKPRHGGNKNPTCHFSVSNISSHSSFFHFFLHVLSSIC